MYLYISLFIYLIDIHPETLKIEPLKRLNLASHTCTAVRGQSRNTGKETALRLGALVQFSRFTRMIHFIRLKTV